MPPTTISMYGTITTYGNGSVWVSIGNQTATSATVSSLIPGLRTNSTTTTYDNWITSTRPVNHGQLFPTQHHPPPEPLTEEEIQAQRERRERWRERRREMEHEREVAAERAQELLFRFLTDEQRTSYEGPDRRFDLVGSLGTRFRIRRDPMANIEVLNAQGEVTAALCAHPDDHEGLPSADKHLGQLLALQTDERAIMRVANCHRGTRPLYNGRMEVEV